MDYNIFFINIDGGHNIAIQWYYRNMFVVNNMCYHSSIVVVRKFIYAKL